MESDNQDCIDHSSDDEDAKQRNINIKKKYII